MENIIYKEKVPTYSFVVAILLISCLIFFVILISQFTGRAVPITWPARAVFVVIFALNIIALVSFRELNIVVTDKQISFGFGLFNKKFWLKKIVKVEDGAYKFSNYLGYGIRFGRDNTIGYTPRGGQGLKITFEDEKRPYFIITARAEELKSILNR